MEYFEQYQQRLRSLIGRAQARSLVNKALVLVTLGGNDFVNNYYLIAFSVRSREFSLPDYIQFLISEYKKILKRIYDLGARRVIVTGTGPIGCAPSVIAERSLNGDCDVEMQYAASLFGPQLVRSINELNRQIGSNVFIAVNAYKMHMDYISSPRQYGFTTSKIACCGQGRYNGLGLCTAVSNLCSNRDKYVFWDGYHPTQRANRLIVGQFMTASDEYMHPMNLSTIIAIDETES